MPTILVGLASPGGVSDSVWAVGQAGPSASATIGGAALADLKREAAAADFDLIFGHSGDDTIDIERRQLERRQAVDLVLLGEGLTRPSSHEVCRALRAESTVPIIALADERDEFDRVVGPLSAREILAYCRALLRRLRLDERRLAEAAGSILRSGRLSMDLRQHQVELDGRTVALKRKEFELLAFMMRRPDRVYSRDELIHEVWGARVADGTRTVDIHIRCLREKIETDSSNPVRLQTVRGVGYRFAASSPG